MKTIVLGYDETPAAKRALERAAEVAKAFGSTVIVTSVAPVAPSGPRGGGPIDPTDPPKRHSEQLDHARARLGDLGVVAETVAAMGDPASSIVELAESRGADLIVVGTRELGWLERALGQSVSAGVLHHAHCDVLIVH
jgi:nucleotide-binding universal stress UspA family protein